MPHPAQSSPGSTHVTDIIICIRYSVNVTCKLWFCSSFLDIYCMSVRPGRESSSVALPQVSSIIFFTPCKKVFFLSTWQVLPLSDRGCKDRGCRSLYGWLSQQCDCDCGLLSRGSAPLAFWNVVCDWHYRTSTPENREMINALFNPRSVRVISELCSCWLTPTPSTQHSVQT